MTRPQLDLLATRDPDYYVVMCKVRLPIREAHKTYRLLKAEIDKEAIRESRRAKAGTIK